MKSKVNVFATILIVLSLVGSIYAFIMHNLTFDAFNYNVDYWVIALTIIAVWSIIMLLVQRIWFKDTVLLFDIFYLIAAFSLFLGALLFLKPCLSPIGIYFTVNNMGDVEANALGVPRCISTMIGYGASLLCLIVASFLGKKK